MIFRRTGDALEKSNDANKAMNVVIVLLAVVLLFNVLSGIVQINSRLHTATAEISSVDKIEQRIEWNGFSKGLDNWANGPYAFAEDSAHQERWALSEYYAERFLEEAWRSAGDDTEADRAHVRAETWAGRTGRLSPQDAEDALAGVSP